MSYIKYGWDKLLVDPDNGENCRRKLATVSDASSPNVNLFQSVPDAEDIHWTNRLYNLPKITFGTIYDYLVDRKMVLEKICCLESMADKRAEAGIQRYLKQMVMVYLLSTLGHWTKRIIFSKMATCRKSNITLCLMFPITYALLPLFYHP